MNIVPEAAVTDQPGGGVVRGAGEHRATIHGGGRRQELTAAVAALARWGWEREWVGPDPYEALNAKRAGALRRSSLGKRLLTQLVKRSPLDLRGPLGIEPQLSSVSAAHVLAASVRLGAGRERLEWGLDALRRLRCEGYPPGQACWGYHFDVQTRFFFYAANTPNVIATAFAGEALLDLHLATRTESAATSQAALELALGACEFLLREVPQSTEPGPGAYFGYLPGDRTPIHNASLLVSALLARAGRLTAQARLLEPAREGLSYALAHQREDGSWPYAETPQGDWVDGFHTGYVLDALAGCAKALEDETAWAAYERGLSFYWERLFEADGTPKYFVDSLHPVDGQSAAQGIRSFAIAAGTGRDRLGPEWPERAWRVFAYSQRRLARRDGAYYFQRRRLWINRTPQVRWVQAPMFDALARLGALGGGAVDGPDRALGG